MKSPLLPEPFAALRRLDACLLANAIETFAERLRNEGFTDQTVRCLFPHLQPMLGYAVPIKIRGSEPPTVSGAYPDRTDWWKFILSVPAPRVIVIQDMASHHGLGALVGEVHMSILRALKCVGVVTNGSVRDLPAAENAGFHFFSGGVSVSHAYVHIIDIGQPVEIGGLKIQAGELLHGDRHGVQNIPLDIADQIPAAAAKITAHRQALIKLCGSPDFSLEKLTAAVAEERF